MVGVFIIAFFRPFSQTFPLSFLCWSNVRRRNLAEQRTLNSKMGIKWRRKTISNNIAHTHTQKHNCTANHTLANYTKTKCVPVDGTMFIVVHFIIINTFCFCVFYWYIIRFCVVRLCSTVWISNLVDYLLPATAWHSNRWWLFHLLILILLLFLLFLFIAHEKCRSNYSIYSKNAFTLIDPTDERMSNKTPTQNALNFEKKNSIRMK